MDMTGQYRILAPRERVWEGLNDPEILRQSITGCDEIEKTSATEFVAKVTAKVGPVKAKFGGKVTLSDIDPPNGYTISGEGTGGAAGFAKGGAAVRLIQDGPETILSYTVSASVGGKLAQIGSRLIDATARKMADEFFSKFAELMTVPAEAPTAIETPPVEAVADDRPAAPPPAPPTGMATGMAPPRGRTLSPVIWIPGLVVIAALVLWYFAG